jgi:hypothetical protein
MNIKTALKNIGICAAIFAAMLVISGIDSIVEIIFFGG